MAHLSSHVLCLEEEVIFSNLHVALPSRTVVVGSIVVNF